jgi:hypothetical protein
MSDLPPEFPSTPPDVCSDDFAWASEGMDAAAHSTPDWILLPKVRLTIKEVEIYGTFNFKSYGDH